MCQAEFDLFEVVARGHRTRPCGVVDMGLYSTISPRRQNAVELGFRDTRCTTRSNNQSLLLIEPGFDHSLHAPAQILGK
jgi:hypothetical protein